MSQKSASQNHIDRLESELVSGFANAPAELAVGTRLSLSMKRGSLNALKHGLSGQNLILTPEELPHYAKMGLEFMREIAPVGAREIGAAQLIFEAHWRLHRILSVENDLFCLAPPDPARPDHPDNSPRFRAHGLERQVNAFRQEARNIEIISRYETRLLRNAARLNEELEKLQKARGQKRPFDEAASPAVLWYRELLERGEALAHAIQHEQNSAVPPANPTTPTESAASPVNPFRKNRSSKPSGFPQTPSKPPRPHHETTPKAA